MKNKGMSIVADVVIIILGSIAIIVIAATLVKEIQNVNTAVFAVVLAISSLAASFFCLIASVMAIKEIKRIMKQMEIEEEKKQEEEKE